jgi:hypothetical protein
VSRSRPAVGQDTLSALCTLENVRPDTPTRTPERPPATSRGGGAASGYLETDPLEPGPRNAVVEAAVRALSEAAAWEGPTT